MAVPPLLLIEAFRKLETNETLAVIAGENGFDVVAMRVLAAWRNTDHVWMPPKKPCPDDAHPTAAAWRWLVRGWQIDITAVARGAGVSRNIAHDKIDQLVDARLIYPDGTMAKAAENALKLHVADRLIPGGLKPPKGEKSKGKEFDGEPN